MKNLDRIFDVYAACYAYAAENHGGQFTRAYSLLGKLENKGFLPGLSVRVYGRDGLSEDGRDIYDALVARRY